mgnify:CR=1 FL=1
MFESCRDHLRGVKPKKTDARWRLFLCLKFSELAVFSASNSLRVYLHQVVSVGICVGTTLRKLERCGVLDKLRKIRQACNQVFRYAIVTGRAESNPASELASALTPPKSVHYPHLSADELPAFLEALAAYSGSPITRLATEILMLTGVRTIELRMAEWKEFDFDKRVWEVPVERVKMRRPHLVPLSDQVVAALREILNIVSPVLTMGA